MIFDGQLTHKIFDIIKLSGYENEQSMNVFRSVEASCAII